MVLEEFEKSGDKQDIAWFKELLYVSKHNENVEHSSLRSKSTNPSFLEKHKQQSLQSYKQGKVKSTEQLLQKFSSVD